MGFCSVSGNVYCIGVGIGVVLWVFVWGCSWGINSKDEYVFGRVCEEFRGFVVTCVYVGTRV